MLVGKRLPWGWATPANPWLWKEASAQWGWGRVVVAGSWATAPASLWSLSCQPVSVGSCLWLGKPTAEFCRFSLVDGGRGHSQFGILQSKPRQIRSVFVPQSCVLQSLTCTPKVWDSCSFWCGLRLWSSLSQPALVRGQNQHRYT